MVHAINRYAEIYLAHSNGTLVASHNLGNVRLSLQSIMKALTMTTITNLQRNSLVASEPVSWEKEGTGLAAYCFCFLIAGRGRERGG